MLIMKRLKFLYTGIALVAVLGGLFLAQIMWAPQAFACATGESSVNFGAGEMCCPSGAASSAEDCMTAKYINPLIKVLASVAGVAVVGGLIWGGIQYSSSAGDPQKVAKGKKTIVSALTGLVAFLLLGSFIQFMAPVSFAGSTGDCSRSFLGLKTWYAYLPTNYVDAKTCTVAADLPLLPIAKNDPGIIAPVALAIVDNLLRIAALVALAFVIVGGTRYITSQGQPNETKLALSSIINALIGLAVAMFAAVIVSFLGKALFT